MERPAKYGNQLVATPDDVAKEEGARAASFDAIKNKPDPNVGETFAPGSTGRRSGPPRPSIRFCNEPC